MLAHLQRTITFVVVVVLVGMAMERATARASPAHRSMERCSSRQAAKAELFCARRALHVNSSAARWIRNHKSRTLQATSWPASHYWRSRLKYLAWRVRVDHRLIAEARRRLVPAAPRVGHVALWLCIHRGEGAWNANTGNGYLGGLQMTPGWGGVARPDLLSPSAQMALAERQYRASGYSTSWLEGQWPNTSPPCLGLA